MEGYVKKEDVRKIAVSLLKSFHVRVLFINALDELPLEPVNDGTPATWKAGLHTGYRCSACATTWYFPSNYCPYCGAKMYGVRQ